MGQAHREVRFEDAIEASLLDGGWHRGLGENYDPKLGIDGAELETFLGATQPDEWERRLAFHAGVEDAQRSFKQLVARQIDERGVLDVLRHGVKDRGIHFRLAYFRPAHTIATDALAHYEANRLTVTRQLHYSATDTGKSLDLVLFVNGLPVATAELKNELTRQTVEHAKRQYCTDRDPRELLFARRALVHFAVDQDYVFLTTKLDGDRTHFLPFNIGSNGPGVDGGAGNPAAADGYRTSYLWEQVWQRDTWLDLLRRYVHVQNPRIADGKPKGRARTDPHTASKIFPRYHQWHAVQALTTHAATHGAGNNYLVEHSAGSGKSNTIAWLAHRLSSLHTPADGTPLEDGLSPNELVFDKVIVITDRVVLDRQLQETIYQFDHTPGVVQRIDEHSAQLAEALRNDTARIVITTLQKFPYVLEDVAGLGRKRFAIVVDEAHSSQSGESAAALKKVLRRLGSDDVDADGDVLTASALARGRQQNLSFFAFTATPKAKTLELFGTNDGSGNRRPFHVYSMRQAIEEGFILDVLRNYITYKAYWRLANANPDDPEVDPRKAGAQLARFVTMHPENMKQRAEVIVEHFMHHTVRQLGGRAKAMVVTSSREHAVRLYLAIREYLRIQDYPHSPGVLVAISGSLEIDGNEVTEAKLNVMAESELPRRFAYTAADGDGRQDVEYRILVVADKYQTGFDQPLLTTMYVDKSLKDVAAVQTLSRLNRIHPLKSQDDVFVLDFVNDPEAIQAAFQPYFETTITEPTDPGLLYAAQARLLEFQLILESEVAAFVEAYGQAEQAARSDTDWERRHAALYRFTDPARDRYVALSADDPEAADGFRDALRAYIRLYAFLAQVVDFPDTDLEALHLYGRHLANRLPRREDPSVDIGQVDLTHLRTSKTGEHDISLSPAGPQQLPGFTGTGGGSDNDPDAMSLSELIREFNEQYGANLSEADVLHWQETIASADQNAKLVAAAAVNDEENFGIVFEREFPNIVLDRNENDTRNMRRFFDDQAFGRAMTDIGKRMAYRSIRRKITT
jgi:type I restriction enzyme R subunit